MVILHLDKEVRRMERRMDRPVDHIREKRTISEIFGGQQPKSMVIRISSEDYSAIQAISRRRESVFRAFFRPLRLKTK